VLSRVDDPADPRLAPFRSLRDRDLAAEGLFVAEGFEVVRSLLGSGIEVRSILVVPSRTDTVVALAGGREVLVAEAELVKATVGFDFHRGVVAAAVRPPPRQVGELSAAGCLAVLEGLSDIENLGAIFRSALALGVDGILLDPTCADPLYRRCVRVSMGATFLLPWARAASWPGELGDLKLAGFRLLALTPAAEAMPIDRVERRTNTGLMLGSEGWGLSEQALSYADSFVRIPIRPGVDSLNVGHAAAIAFHELGPIGGPGSRASES
jgi:tRNA G18 (ribose-2'-O)-methylase SpoU